MNFEWKEFLVFLKASYPSLYIWLEKADGSYIEEENKCIIEVPDSFHKKTINEKYKQDILKAIREKLNPDTLFSIEVKKSGRKDNPVKITVREQQIALPLETKPETIPNLNSKFRFDNFIVGDSNRFAHAACRAVAEAPGQTYNPLFIYGGVGLGKTHLLHAIGNYLYETNPSAKILITTAERFIFEVVQSIGSKKMDEFKERYRSVDLLLVDDIQFLQKGEAAREEFFHTFNELYNFNKQIVATSDSHPSELKLEDRLKSRFSAGIIVDMQQPNFETRVAILRQNAREMNRSVPDNAIALIAEHVDSNIRALKATLLTLLALASHQNDEITIDFARQAIKMTNPAFESGRKIGIDTIQEITADYFNIKVQDLSSKKRPENIARARQVAMYITRNLTDYSLVQIGQYFGGKDHTTVMHAIEKVDKLMKDDDKFKAMVEELFARIKK